LTSPNQHTGLDVGVAYNTPIHSLAAGTVLCVGDAGTEMPWGQGCGAYNDTGDDGPGSPRLGKGNITIMQDNGFKVTYGHSRESWVSPGERVAAGQQIGTSGGMFGAHSHIEVTTCQPELTGIDWSCYWLWDPEVKLREAMDPNGVTPACQREPVPQPQEWDWSIVVTTTREGVPVLQRANLDSCPVSAPLTKGEQFEAVMLVLGQDMNWYWISRQGGRVPIDGTSAPDGPQIPTG
jgi:hypothetical protein